MKVGNKIPSFKLPDQDWNDVHSEELLGEPFVIYFYPKDDTPGCTKQACAFRDHFSAFEDRGVKVIGVSADSPEDHRHFKEKYSLPFRLLSDPDRKLHKEFGVGKHLLGLLPGRVTYIFDAEGILVHTFSSPTNMVRHVAESLDALKELQ
ncbi:MAG: peroxiredoxin [Flavobacteriales bacterium]|nr:peroxiredoxin [Flavobacteriales bacterium]